MNKKNRLTHQHGFSKSDLRYLTPQRVEKDKKNGWDIENRTWNGKPQDHQVVQRPYKKDFPWIYVKLEDRSFRFSIRPENRKPNIPGQRQGPTLPHSVLARGEPVIGAGECETDEKGNIISANNFSGHYKPGNKNLEETKKNMEAQGLSDDSTQWDYRHPD